MILIDFLRETPGGNFVYTNNLVKFISMDEFWSRNVVIAISKSNLNKLSFDTSTLNFEVFDMPVSIGKAISTQRDIIKKITIRYNGDIDSYLNPNTLLPFLYLINVRMFSVVHDLNFLTLKLSLLQKIYKYFLYQFTAYNSDRIFCISRFTQGVYHKFSLVDISNKSEVIYNGIDVNKLNSFGVLPNLKEDYVVSFGHQKHKNVEGSIALIEAYNKINRDSPLFLKVVGDGEYVEKLKIEYSNIPYVEWLGILDEAELYNLLARAQFLFFLSKYEGFGLPVFEAFALKTVVVISQQQALVEVSGGNSVIHNCLQDTVVTISDFVKNKEQYLNHTNKAFDYVRDYTWEETFERLLSRLK